MSLKLFCFSVFIFSFQATASEKDFKIGGKNFSVSFPATWDAKEGIVGLPLAVLGPMQKDRTRPVVSFTGPDKETTKAFMDAEFVKALRKKLTSTRQSWAKKHKVKIIDFLPSELKKLPKGQRLSFGVRYDREGKRKTEISYYITCNGMFVMSKLMMTAANEGFLSEAEGIVESLQCK